jgi:hypothetical protein
MYRVLKGSVFSRFVTPEGDYLDVSKIYHLVEENSRLANPSDFHIHRQEYNNREYEGDPGDVLERVKSGERYLIQQSIHLGLLYEITPTIAISVIAKLILQDPDTRQEIASMIRRLGTEGEYTAEKLVERYYEWKRENESLLKLGGYGKNAPVSKKPLLTQSASNAATLAVPPNLSTTLPENTQGKGKGGKGWGGRGGRHGTGGKGGKGGKGG